MGTRKKAKRKLEPEALTRIAEENPKALSADGFEDCILGLAYRAGQEVVLAYDRNKCVAKLMKDGMTHEDAEEHMGFNVEGAWVGEGTPIFVEVVL